MTQVAGGLRGSVRAQEQSAGVRFGCFDGFRAIAALSVLVTHVAFITGANARNWFGAFFARMDAGVAVFFVISGFLLYRPYVAAHFADRLAPALGPYLRRRALRLFPAYWLVLIVVLVAFHARTGGVGNLVSMFTLTHIYRVDTLAGPATGTITAPGHPLSLSWSICTELSFYLFLPLYAWLISRRSSTPAGISPRATTAARRWPVLRRELTGVAVLYLAAVVFRVVIFAGDLSGNGGEPYPNLVTWLPNQLDLFALGMLLAVVSVWTVEHRDRAPFGLDGRWALPVCWGLAALAFVAVAKGIGLPTMSITYTDTQQYLRQFLYGATAFFMIVPGVFGPQRGLARGVLRSSVVQWLGLVSYGIYLWQDIVIERYRKRAQVPVFGGSFLQVLTAVTVVTVAVATLSFVFLERPMLRLKRRHGARPAKVVR